MPGDQLLRNEISIDKVVNFVSGNETNRESRHLKLRVNIDCFRWKK